MRNLILCSGVETIHTHVLASYQYLLNIRVGILWICANAILLPFNGSSLAYSFKRFVDDEHTHTHKHTIDCRWWIRNIINETVFQFRYLSTPDQNIYKQPKHTHSHTHAQPMTQFWIIVVCSPTWFRWMFMSLFVSLCVILSLCLVRIYNISLKMAQNQKWKTKQITLNLCCGRASALVYIYTQRHRHSINSNHQ